MKTTFSIVVPAKPASALRPSYVSPSTLSVTIALNTVNAGQPPAGLTTSVTTNISSSACSSGCTLGGPDVPPGNDSFTITTYDASNATGNALSTDTQTFAISSGTANSVSATLLGIANSLTISGVPSATAGTAFGSPATLSVSALDADGNTIAGAYANAVTLTDSDTSSLAHASSLSVNAGSTASSVTISSSSDVVKLHYGGQAIAQATLTASATGALTGTGHFTPTLQPIVPAISAFNFYTTSGAGSSGSTSVSETGWSNAPYNQNFVISVPVGCSSVATVSGNATSTSGTSFTTTAASGASAGSCTATVTDGAGQSAPITLTYTTSGFTIDGRTQDRP